MSQSSAHNANRLFTGLILAVLLAVSQPALESVRNFFFDYRAVLTLNSPFKTASHYYHPGDQVDFVVARTANFEAAFVGTRILERVYPGTHMSEKILSEPISGGIQLSPTDPKGPHELEPLQYKAHPTLPETVMIDRKVVPLPRASTAGATRRPTRSTTTSTTTRAGPRISGWWRPTCRSRK